MVEVMALTSLPIHSPTAVVTLAATYVQTSTPLNLLIPLTPIVGLRWQPGK